MNNPKRDVIQAGIWATGFVKWAAEKYGLQPDAAADLIITTAQTDQTKLNEMVGEFENRSTQMQFDFDK
jgi:hypothetical protein